MRVDELFSSIRCCRFGRTIGRNRDVRDGSRGVLANSKHIGHLLVGHKSGEICLNRKREHLTDIRNRLSRLVVALDIQELEQSSLELNSLEPDNSPQELDSFETEPNMQEVGNLEKQEPEQIVHSLEIDSLERQVVIEIHSQRLASNVHSPFRLP